MRLAVYTDYVYRRAGGVLYAERAFAVFLAALAREPRIASLRLIGRLAHDGAAAPYALAPDVELAPLPHYASLARPWAAFRALLISGPAMWRALDEVDAVWVLGPYPHAIALVLLALCRRRTVVLGVRQEWPRYVRERRPGRRALHLAADALEGIWRLFARRLPVVAVGPRLAAAYAHAPAVLDLAVSLVPGATLETAPANRSYDGELRLLSVTRLEPEKNPLLLADVLAALVSNGGRWRLTVVGEGDLAGALERRLEQRGVAEKATLLGYVPTGERLFEHYAASHALLHTSLTEGFPQVLIEAFAHGLPVIATDVGGVAAGARGAALLISPRDVPAAVRAIEQVAADPELRARLTAHGFERARTMTLEGQCARLASFLLDAAR